MAHLLAADRIGITRGHRPILADVSVSLADGSRVGVVGANGGGKTTLLRMLAGTLAPDTGRVTRTHDSRIAFLLQADSFAEGSTVYEVIHSTAAVHEWASDAHIRRLHAGLLPDIALDSKVDELSGGQRRRVALAATLCQDASIVMLDEPTNHLDIDGITFLADYLNERFGGARVRGALIVVTHDRWFLDAVCTRLWDVVPGVDERGGTAPQPGRVETYEGGYAAYILQRAERERQAAVAAAKRNNILRKELAWLRRGAPARTSKPRFRIEAAEALIADEPAPRDTVELTRMATARLGKDVIDLEGASFAYPGGEDVLHNVTLRLAPGQRIGVLGPNGAGKSSLLGLISGKLQATAGRVKTGKTVRLAALTQETRELDEVADLRVVEAASEVATRVTVGKKELTASQLVERLGFTRQRAWTAVADLSGGERRRLQLLRLLMAEPNVLLLDEPTNDLDTDTLAAVEDLLDSWPGTLVVVSHDRYLLERLTDQQYAVLGSAVRHLPGGVDEYLRLRENAAVRAAGVQAAPAERPAEQKTTRAAENDGGSATPLSGAQEHALRKELHAVERKMDRAARTVEAIHERMAAHDPSDFEGLRALDDELREVQAANEQLEQRWFEISEQLE
ncbi:ABC-F family ATP-binding cassette domain-containing protein [Actinobaculum sp. 352]|uniref:ABC-F family ATP-binding cassette domain-containing protein n=1 Tax=Actinobaculum sp. 352 TaxID=2490946 RepID=UPI0019D0DFDD|nr:ABC-F family ATP-binding cassette domain-containing protein [Actinobaculum sp. 352]